jgi:hypothetical protein
MALQSKKSIYLLVPLVIIVWGLIAYKIINYTRDDTAKSTLTDVIPDKKTTTDPPLSDTLMLNYNDPFLKSGSTTRPLEAKPALILKNAFTSTPSPKAKVQWPAISLRCIIQNKTTTHYTANIMINNKEYLLSKGGMAEDITITDIDHRSITLQLGTEKQTLKIKD